MMWLSLLVVMIAGIAGSSTEFPGCGTAGVHGPVNKTVVNDLGSGQCAIFVSHDHKAIYITPALYPKVMTKVTSALCEGYQCHPMELTRYHRVRASMMAEYFVFTFVKNPWMRASHLRTVDADHAACALGRVDFVGRVEHVDTDWDHMMAIMSHEPDYVPKPDTTPAASRCAEISHELEYAVSVWYSRDIVAYDFPRPADLGKLFYASTMLK